MNHKRIYEDNEIVKVFIHIYVYILGKIRRPTCEFINSSTISCSFSLLRF